MNRLGTWTLDEQIGTGADATVWRARGEDGAVVALKVIPTARVRDPERHLREVWAAGATGCPHVVTVHDTGRAGDQLWIAMELMPGGDLAQAVAARGRLTLGESLAHARDAALGLAALHDHGFVHRDIKPANLLLDASGHVRIGDLAPARGGGTATRSGDLGGTPAFLSPEQAQGQTPDARSDLFSLGATLIALLTGHPPFAGATAVELVRAIVDGPHPSIRLPDATATARLAAVLDRCLAKRADQRHATARQLAEDLDDLIANRAPRHATRPVAVSSATRPVVAAPAAPWRWSWLAGAAALGVAAGWWLMLPRGGESAAVVIARAGGSPAAWQKLAEAGSPAERDEANVALAAHATREAAIAARQAEVDAEVALLRQRREAAAFLAKAKPTAPPAAVAAPVVPTPAPPPAPQRTSVAAAAKPPTPVTPAAPAAPPTSAAPPTPAAPRLTFATPIEAPALETTIVVRPFPALPAPPVLVAWNPRLSGGLLLVDRNGGLHGSSNTGHSWQPLCPGQQESLSSMPRMQIRVQAQGSTLFLPCGDRKVLGWLSRDDGRTFATIGMPALPGQYPTILQRLLEPDGSLVVIHGSTHQPSAVVSRDGGATWQPHPVEAQVWQRIPFGGRTVVLRSSNRDGSGFALDDGPVTCPLRNYSNNMPWYDSGTRLDIFDSGLKARFTLDGLSATWSSSTLQPWPNDSPVALVVDPADARTLVVADADWGLVRSTDGGVTWQRFLRPFTGGIHSLDLQGAQRPLLLAATERSLLLADLHHLPAQAFRTIVPTPAAQPMSASSPEGVACLATDPKHLVVWQHNALHRSDDGGASWQTTALPKGSWWTSRLLWTTNGKRMFLPSHSHEGQAGLLSLDGGDSFTAVPEPPSDIDERDAWALLEDGTLVYAEDASESVRLHRRSAKGTRWETTTIATPTASSPRLVPWQQGVLLLCAFDGQLAASFDGGQRRLYAGIAAHGSTDPLFWSPPTAALLDAENRMVVAFDASNRRWSQQPMQVPSGWWRSWAWDPARPQRLWLYGEAGLVFTPDGGRTWRTTLQAVTGQSEARLVLTPGRSPRLLYAGDKCLWSFDATPAGDSAFDVEWNPVP